MLAYIKGTIKLKSSHFLVVENNGLGYKIFSTEKNIQEAKIGEVFEFFLFQNVKEDALDLYGFTKPEELALFKKLISVSGVGPKTALGVFAVASFQDIQSAIISGDASILKKVSGIGAKTAERIVLELKNKIVALEGINVKSSQELEGSSDALEALISLGYSASEARDALSKADSSITDSGEKVKFALQYLKK